MKSLNKNISVWRGSDTPPTKYHIWYNENDDQLYIQKGTDGWSVIMEGEETRKANEKIREENEKIRQEQEDARELANNTALVNFSNKETEFDDQEKARVDAETKREEEFAKIIGEAENVDANIDGPVLRITNRKGEVQTYELERWAEFKEIEDKLNEILESINGNTTGES